MNTSLVLLATLLESLNLQILSHTTKVWGHQKSFKVFGFYGKVRCVSGKLGLDKLRLELKPEFWAYFGRNDDRLNSCRVYACIISLKDGLAVGIHVQSSRFTSSTVSKCCGRGWVINLCWSTIQPQTFIEHWLKWWKTLSRIQVKSDIDVGLGIGNEYTLLGYNELSSSKSLMLNRMFYVIISLCEWISYLTVN